MFFRVHWLLENPLQSLVLTLIVDIFESLYIYTAFMVAFFVMVLECLDLSPSSATSTLANETHLGNQNIFGYVWCPNMEASQTGVL